MTSIYSALDYEAKQIRIFTIESSLDPQGRVSGQLSTVSLLESESTEYIALSWYWGNASCRKQILVNGTEYYIAENAVEVLVKACVARQCTRVWLDAVCINQEDLDERGHQVSFMDEIYSRAKGVVVWLGDDGAELTQRALTSVDMLKKQFLHYTDETFKLNHEKDSQLFYQKRLRIFQGQEYPWPLFSMMALPDCDWQAVEHFFSAFWFQRLWVCQEVMLNHNVTCVRGSIECRWFDIGLAAKWMDHCRYWRTAHVGKRIGNIDSTAGVWAHTYILPPDWENLLGFTRTRRATLSVDYVYGLLGLVPKSSASQIARQEKDLIPDYTKTLALVFAAATRVAIKARQPYTNALNVLLAAHTLIEPLPPAPYAGIETEDDEEWPSWVPRYDWVFDSERGSPPQFNDWHGDNAAGIYRATQMADYSTSPLILGLTGVIVSRIVEVGIRLDREAFKNTAALRQEIINWKQRAEETGMSSTEFAMTLTSRKNHLEEDAAKDSEFPMNYEAFVSDCHDESDSHPWSANAQPFIEALWRGSANKRLFALEDDRIGVGYPLAQVGDIVCIFFSGMAPFILRLDKDYHKLIGHAYIHNIMHGEFIAQWQKGPFHDGEVQNFQIK